jgi:hypothetical protein
LSLAAAGGADLVAVLRRPGRAVEEREEQSHLQLGPAAMVYDQGWRVGIDVRLAVDLNGDHRTDLIGFGPDGVWDVFAGSNGFNAARKDSGELGVNTGWNASNSIRTVADFNGDHVPDIVAIGPPDARVGLGSAGGGFFAATVPWSTDYTAAAGWDPARHALLVGDVNGDGRADLVGVNDWGVYVSLSTGTSFGPQKMWLRDFPAIAGSWDATKHVRMLADINNDGRADLVGFGDDGVYVSFSDGTRFSPFIQASTAFGYNTGWRIGAWVGIQISTSSAWAYATTTRS